jgi:LacI family transcriptional regulator
MILVAPVDFTDSVAEALGRRTPFVLLHSDTGTFGVDNVAVDDEAASYAIVDYLCSLSHRRIAHFGGPTSRSGAMLRVDGYRRALAEHGIKFDPSLVTHGPYAASNGRDLAQQMLDQYPREKLPTAIFCATDAIAFGCMEVLNRNGIRIPDDMSITGFDGLLQSLMTVPALTTIQQPLRSMGRYAVERLLHRINEGVSNPSNQAATLSRPFPAVSGVRAHTEDATAAELEPPHTEVFPCELIIRASSGPPRRNYRRPSAY